MGTPQSALCTQPTSTMIIAKLNLWNHWFWITFLFATALCDHDRDDGDLRETEPLVHTQDLNETDPKGTISKSVSVSKVSVKVGDVRIARTLEQFENQRNDFVDHQQPPVLNPRASQPFDNLINHFMEQIRYFASVEAANQTDDNLNYLYDMYNSIGEDYYDETDLNDIVGDNTNDLEKEFSRNEDSSVRAEDFEEEFIEQLFENGSLIAENLVTEEPVTVSKDFVDKFLNVSKLKEDVVGTTIEDFVVELKSTNNNSDVIKIGIFITVTIAVLIMTGGLVFFMMKRKIKTVMETNLVTNEHHTKGHSQFVFQSRGMRGFTTGTVQENFTNHFGKSSAYLYDDLHSLDNDSFLTSLETISEKDKFNWE